MIINSQQLSRRQGRLTKFKGVPVILCFVLVLAFDGKAKTKSKKDVTANRTLQEKVYEVLAIPVTGKITDEKGEGLIGATVVIKGTTTGTTTDIDGNFSMEVPDNTTVLVISYAGYKSQEITVGTQTTINIQLEEDVQLGEDIVVVGYGAQKKTSVTGAISQVSAKDISSVPVANLSGALQGRAAGVIVTSNGAPGEAPVVRIRGVGSIGLSADPLYVIDGFPVTDPNFLNNFDQRDVETMEVLKDAASSSIYGSRASNGVVLITTKKGNSKDKKLHVNLDSYVGTQTVWRKLDLLNTQQYRQYANDLLNGVNLPTRFIDSNWNAPLYEGTNQTYAQTNTDWQSELFKPALISQTSLNVAGGTDLSRFYMSGGYFQQKGIVAGTGYERANFRLNSDHSVSKKITVGQTLSFAYGDRSNLQESQGRSLIMHTIRSIPYLPVYDPTKLGGYRGAAGPDVSDVDNPIKVAKLNSDRTTNAKLFGTVFLEWKITDWLKFRTTEGIDYNNNNTNIYRPIYNDGRNSLPSAYLEQRRIPTVTTLFSQQLTFDKTFGKHYINAIAVAEQQGSTTNNVTTIGNLSYNNVMQQNGLTNPSITGTKQQNYLISYLGRLNYEYGGKYLLGLSMRSDGSSKFAPGNRWGTFPAFSAGWRISEENFMKGIAAISELKFRGSYGIVGFNGIGNYDWQSVTNTDLTAYNLGGANPSGTYFNALSNKALKWETSKMTNIGIDLGLLGNKFTFSAEYFTKLTENLILPINIAPSLGYTQLPVSNIGSMKNYGMEFQAGYNVVKGNFRSNLTGNLAFVRNKVLSLDNPSSEIQAGSLISQDFGGYNFTRTRAGDPIQQFYGWKTQGLFQTQEEINQLNAIDGDTATKYQDGATPGDIKFKDVNGDGKITDADREVLGSFLPKFTYGLNYSAAWKGLDVTIFFQGVHGNKIYNGTKVLTEGMTLLMNAGTEVLNAWTPTNTNTDIPKADALNANRNARTSDRFVESGSYLRLKNIMIGYTLPESFVKSITHGSLSNVRLYVSSQNLLTFTKYTGYDPEIALGPRLAASGGTNTGTNAGVQGLLTNGVDLGQAPQARSFMGGIQIGF